MKNLEKIALGLTIVASAEALKHSGKVNSAKENRVDDDKDYTGLVELAVFVVIAISYGCTILCGIHSRRNRLLNSETTIVADDIINNTRGLQRVEEQRGRYEIVDTRDITEVEIEIDDSNSDVTIVAYSKDPKPEKLPRVLDLSRF